MKKSKKNLDFEINLLPVIGVLAITLGFLLITAVWVNVGTFNLSQAVGTEDTGASKTQPSLWVHFENNGTVHMSVKQAGNLDKNLQLKVIRSFGGVKPDVSQIESFAKTLKEELPELNIALLMPAPESAYEDLVQVMDKLRKIEISDIGIAPL